MLENVSAPQLVAFLFIILAVTIEISRRRDVTILAKCSREVFAGSGSLSDKVDRLNTWVYRKEGFAKNRHYFLLRKLGPTPLQIFEYGGDCSDKSRMLAAMLRSVGVKSTLVMLHSSSNGPAGHTVLEARFEDGCIVVDPVYDLSFPADEGRYYGVKDLRDNDEILENRIDELVAIRGPTDKVAYYRKSSDGAHYRFPKTINWEKNRITRMVLPLLRAVTDEPMLLQRPHFLEDPKLFMALASLLSAIFLCSALLF